MSGVTRRPISEPTKCSPQLSTSPSTYYSVSPPTNSPPLTNGPNEQVSRRGSLEQFSLFKPNEMLQSYSDDMNMLGPMLMYNLENIKSYRADCRYKRPRN